MSTITIESRWDYRTLYETIAETAREATEKAVAAKVNLRGADLRGADLRGADLRGANLRGANLGGANLGGADLGGANLRGADLRGADLGGADLRNADLRNADLGGADLRGADLRGADLVIPIIPDIHARVYAAASQPSALEMAVWHTCATTHCRAGWVVRLAGAAGLDLERRFGTGVAAALIYQASDPTMDRVPNWNATDEEALADMGRLTEGVE